MTGEEAKEQILRENPDIKVFIVPENALLTTDYRPDRLRIFVNKDNIVVKVPKLG